MVGTIPDPSKQFLQHRQCLALQLCSFTSATFSEMAAGASVPTSERKITVNTTLPGLPALPYILRGGKTPGSVAGLPHLIPRHPEIFNLPALFASRLRCFVPDKLLREEPQPCLHAASENEALHYVTDIV